MSALTSRAAVHQAYRKQHGEFLQQLGEGSLDYRDAFGGSPGCPFGSNYLDFASFTLVGMSLHGLH
jgi:hypothetical protein